jgi:glycosyltransferase involved in cell wall biosynthesis
VTFLSSTGDVDYIHRFLNTLDFYTHARIDGEQCSTALMEAMFHGLPIISHGAPSMGQVDQIGDSGFVCSSCDEYAHRILALCEDKTRDDLSFLAKKRYEEKYSLSSVVDSYVKIYDTIS